MNWDPACDLHGVPSLTPIGHDVWLSNMLFPSTRSPFCINSAGMLPRALHKLFLIEIRESVQRSARGNPDAKAAEQKA
ncbi:hypothetical protein VNO77_34324 [Canavalia gladiata]|uniref:Uncharacterized protein n=1 Tax=Canavalia gladiata TaxID=3824 RepID=A0AAN9PZ58_CANGL